MAVITISGVRASVLQLAIKTPITASNSLEHAIGLDLIANGEGLIVMKAPTTIGRRWVLG